MPSLIKSLKGNKLINSSNIYDNGRLLNKVLENYRRIINQMPTVDGDGESITLNGCINAEFLKFELGGNTSQEEGVTPENPKEIHCIKGNSKIIVQNKNWFDEKNPLHYSTNASGNTSISTVYNSTDYIECNSEETWAISGKKDNPGDYAIKLVFYDENKNFISRPIANDNGGVAQTPVNAKYVMGQFYNTTSNCLLEKNATTTSFVEHEEETAEFTLKEGQFMYEGDYLADDGIHHVMNKKIFVGSDDENWSTFGNAGITTRRYVIDIPSKKKGDNYNSDVCICNRFKQGLNNNEDNFIMTHKNSSILWIGSTQLQDMSLAEYKEYLSENNLEIVYELDEEIFEPYTQTQKQQYNKLKTLFSYAGTTNITQENEDLPFKLSVSALKDLHTLEYANYLNE